MNSAFISKSRIGKIMRERWHKQACTKERVYFRVKDGKNHEEGRCKRGEVTSMITYLRHVPRRENNVAIPNASQSG